LTTNNDYVVLVTVVVGTIDFRYKIEYHFFLFLNNGKCCSKYQSEKINILDSLGSEISITSNCIILKRYTHTWLTDQYNKILWHGY